MHRLIGVLILILASAGLTLKINDLKVFGYNAVCLPKNKTLDNEEYNSYSPFMIVETVSELNGFLADDLSMDEKEVYQVFLTELDNYRETSQIMKTRLKFRLRESHFSKPQLRAIPKPNLDEQMRKIFEFANETIDMIENNAIPKSLSDEKFRSGIEFQKMLHQLVKSDPEKLRKMNIAIFRSLHQSYSKWYRVYRLAFPSIASCENDCTSSWCMPSEFVDRPYEKRYLKP